MISFGPRKKSLPRDSATKVRRGFQTAKPFFGRFSLWVSRKCGNYSGGLSMTSFFNTNLSNLSNFAERLPEGTIRFVLCTNLANDSNAMRTANLVSIRVIRGGKN